jgi:uncharacterized membrane protein
MYPKARLDALTDGLLGVAMTILVLDVRLPDNFHPHTANSSEHYSTYGQSFFRMR